MLDELLEPTIFDLLESNKIVEIDKMKTFTKKCVLIMVKGKWEIFNKRGRHIGTLSTDNRYRLEVRKRKIDGTY